MHKQKRFDKKGKLISYRLVCSGKDPITQKHKNYTMTWKIPKNLTLQSDIKYELNIVATEFEEKVRKISQGIDNLDENMRFVDFSNDWCDKILVRNEEAYKYRTMAKNCLKVINPYFEKYLLRQLTPNIIQNFYDYLSTRTYTKTIVIVKKSITELIDNQNLKKIEVAENIGINRLTLRLASQVGQQVNINTAKAICRYFNVPIANYFEITKQKVKYSKDTNIGIKTILVVMLSDAKRRGLIEQNYAKSEFTTFEKRKRKKKQVYDENEAREFVLCLKQEKNLKIKAIVSCAIFLGLRECEIAALDWSDINFENNSLSIIKDLVYTSEFGIKIKSTKTEESCRTIGMPIALAQILAEYKVWWDEQKSSHGDLWYEQDKLFLQDNGKPINPQSIYYWVTKFERVNGLKHIPPHSLRHTATTLMLDCGIPLKTVSKILGHANESTTLGIYAHSLKTQEQQASITYNNYLCGND